jgi:hypothetical protein
VVGGGALVEGGAVVGGAWGQRRVVGLLGPVDHSDYGTVCFFV